MKRYLRTRTAVKPQTKTNYNFVVNLLKNEEFCSIQAKAGMNPKTLQYLMGHSEIGVTLDVYTHLGLEDATAELHRMEEVQNA